MWALIEPDRLRGGGWETAPAFHPSRRRDRRHRRSDHWMEHAHRFPRDESLPAIRAARYGERLDESRRRVLRRLPKPDLGKESIRRGDETESRPVTAHDVVEGRHAISIQKARTETLHDRAFVCEGDRFGNIMHELERRASAGDMRAQMSLQTHRMIDVHRVMSE